MYLKYFNKIIDIVNFEFYRIRDIDSIYLAPLNEIQHILDTFFLQGTPLLTKCIQHLNRSREILFTASNMFYPHCPAIAEVHCVGT